MPRDRTPQPSGREFRLDATLSDGQYFPSVAALADGGFVVSWHGQDTANGTTDVFAQRYTAEGDAAGAGFRVNATTADNQTDASVAALADGGFVVSWMSTDPSTYDTDVFAQRYTAAGAPAGAGFRVNATTANDQDDPSVAALADGGFVVSWHSPDDTSNYDVFAQRYTAEGDTAGGEFRVNTTTRSYQYAPSVAGLADGSFMVSWYSQHAPDTNADVYAQRYTAEGDPAGAEFRVNTTTAGGQSSPAATALADGGFVVSWDGASTLDYSSDVSAQRYTAGGAAVGGEFRLNATTVENQYRPSVAALADGRLVASWFGYDADDGISAYGQLFTLPALTSEVGITRSGPLQVEGDSGPTAMTFAVSLDLPLDTEQSVQWRVGQHRVDPAGPEDFTGGAFPSGTVVFAPGETEKTVTVEVAGDAASEPDEFFTVSLESPSAGLVIGAADSITASILDDDLPRVAGTAGADVFVHPRPGQRSVYEGLGGRDPLDFGEGGFRGFRADALQDGRVFLANGPGRIILSGVEEVRFADGRLVFDADDPAVQVARLYEAALDRLPDQGGLNYWIDAVQDGRPLSALASGFLESAEFRSRFGDFVMDNGGFVDRLYRNVLGRDGEAEGREFWVASLNNGAGRAGVLVAFSESAENKAGTAALVGNGVWDRSEAAAEVARLYDTVFGRLPDAQGLAYWRDALESGATLAQTAGAFTGSAEFRGQYGGLDNRQFADALYVNTLDRPADRAGLDYWTGQLDAGVARAAVVLAFSESREHIALTEANVQSEDLGKFGILFA